MDEFLSATTEIDPYVNISDGGHFDNLGLYEMLRRHCNKIVVIDAGADPELKLVDLAKAIRMAQLDMPEGLTVKFQENHLKELCDLENDRSVAIADIVYPAANNQKPRQGTLVYAKPKKSGAMQATVRSYASQFNDFPYKSTTDQWFGESQFSAYATLGEYLGDLAATQI